MLSLDSADLDDTVFQRLAKNLDSMPVEHSEFIQEEHSVMGQ